MGPTLMVVLLAIPAFATGPEKALTTLETEHFALSWGPDVAPEPVLLDALSADLERVWADQVDGLGWRAPDTDRVDVHLGSTGGGSYEIDFSGGYAWFDETGAPYLVVSADILDTYASGEGVEWPLGLLAHEFNHVLQMHVGVESLQEEAFLWEATASWVTEITVGDAPGVAYTSGPEMLLNPQVALTAYGFDPEEPERFEHQYHTAIFLHHLSDTMGRGPDPIRDAWNAGLPGGGLEAISAGVDGGIGAAFTDFALAHVVLDASRPIANEATADEVAFEGWIPDNRIAAVVPAAGVVDGRVADRLRPESLAWNRVHWRSGVEGAVEVRFTPDPMGSDGTPSAFRAFLVERAGGEVEATELDGSASVEVSFGTELELVIVSLARAEEGEKFGYTYDFEVPVFSGPEPARTACGCAAPVPMGWSCILLALWGARRRCSARRAHPTDRERKQPEENHHRREPGARGTSAHPCRRRRRHTPRRGDAGVPVITGLQTGAGPRRFDVVVRAGPVRVAHPPAEPLLLEYTQPGGNAGLAFDGAGAIAGGGGAVGTVVVRSRFRARRAVGAVGTDHVSECEGTEDQDVEHGTSDAGSLPSTSALGS